MLCVHQCWPAAWCMDDKNNNQKVNASVRVMLKYWQLSGWENSVSSLVISPKPQKFLFNNLPISTLRSKIYNNKRCFSSWSVKWWLKSFVHIFTFLKNYLLRIQVKLAGCLQDFLQWERTGVLNSFLSYTAESDLGSCTKVTTTAGFALAGSAELSFTSFLLSSWSKGTVIKSSLAQLPVVTVDSLYFSPFVSVPTVDGSVAEHHSGVQERLGAMIQ